MRTSLWLRIAAGVLLVYAAMHTYGSLFHDHSRGPEQEALFASMRAFTFPVEGLTRTYWSFYRGFAIFTSLGLLLLALLCWQLARLSESHPREARPLVLTVFVVLAAMTWTTWSYFFPAPLVFNAAATVLVGIAALSLRTPDAALPTAHW
jgi:hypothetical protein